MVAGIKIFACLGLLAVLAMAVIVDFSRDLWEAAKEQDEKEDDW